MNKLFAETIVPHVSYAQNREDIIIETLLGDISQPGFYVDIGAAHPHHLSVTKYFYQRGWHGINIEPSHRLSALLKKVRPRDDTFRFAISDDQKHNTAQFREYLGDGLSTLSETMKKEYDKSPSRAVSYYRDYEVPITTLAEVLGKYKTLHIDFMKIDVEGFEAGVLKSNDWKKFRPKIICIEANHGQELWHDFVVKQDYAQVFYDGLNAYYADKLQYEVLPQVDFNRLYDPNIVNPRTAATLQGLSTQLREKTEQALELEKELLARPTADGEGIRFRTLGKVLLKKTDAVITAKLSPAPSSLPTSPPSNNSDDIVTWEKLIQARQQHTVYSSPAVKVRRGVFKGYRGVKKIIKKVAGK